MKIDIQICQDLQVDFRKYIDFNLEVSSVMKILQFFLLVDVTIFANLLSGTFMNELHQSYQETY